MRTVRFILSDILRSKTVLWFTVVLALISWCVFSLEDSTAKAMLTMINLVLLVLPLYALLFSVIYIYNSGEFIEMILAHPVKRRQVWLSLYAGVAISLTVSYILACGIPILLFAPIEQSLTLIGSGVMIQLVFTSLAFLAAVSCRDKSRGIGVALMMWLFFSLLFDGLVLFLLFQFGDYPIEEPMVLLTSFSPIDLARILNLMHLDASAMMGFTGAVFRKNFGETSGMIISGLILILWMIWPLMLSIRIFKKKDL